MYGFKVRKIHRVVRKTTEPEWLTRRTVSHRPRPERLHTSSSATRGMLPTTPTPPPLLLFHFRRTRDFPTNSPPLLQRACAARCGSTCYYQSDINAAVNQGCSNLRNGNTPGGYPHQYNDYEGFDFPDNGPWYEYPILSSYSTYSGGSPGPDRVIFTRSCAYEGSLTHTGASGNNFVQCSG